MYIDVCVCVSVCLLKKDSLFFNRGTLIKWIGCSQSGEIYRVLGGGWLN